MNYRYRHQWRTKLVTLADVARWIREGKYAHRVNAVRGMEIVQTDYGMESGPMAAEWLPKVLPAKGIPRYQSSSVSSQKEEEVGYTGLVLLSFRITTGLETMEQLRRKVNLWQQTLISFVGATGQTLEVIIPYELTSGGVPTDEQQVALFQQYAYKRAAEYALNTTGVRPVEMLHDGHEHFDLSSDVAVYLNPSVMPIMMDQPTEPLTEETAPVMNTCDDLSLDTKVLPGYTRREMDVVKYNAIRKQLAYRELLKLEDHLMRLATECCQAGIDEELSTKLTLESLRCLDREVLVRGTFQTAYEKHKLGMKNPIEKSMIHQLLLEEFLKRRYMFRRNRVTDEIEVQEKYRYELWWKR